MRQLALLCAAVLLSACGSPTDSSGDAPSVIGTWKYDGRQVSGPGGNQVFVYTGQLQVTRQVGVGFDGTFGAEVRDQVGNLRVVSGIVSGSFIDPTVADFDVAIGAETLRHVGTLRGDTLRGNWTSSDGVSMGTFVAVHTTR